MSGLKVPVAVATPPVTVHEVGSRTAGLSLADDNGTEVCTGIVMLGPSDASGDALAIELDGEGLDGEGLDGELDGGALGEGEGLADIGGGAAGSEAVRLPACLPTKNAATHNPIRTTNPATARFRLVDALIELT
jgi:hypothetical protein